MNFRTDFFGRVLSEKFSSGATPAPEAPSSNNSNAIKALAKDLERLARFGANVLDAHSCFIFVPGQILSEIASETQGIAQDTLYLLGTHSLSTSVINGCSIKNEMGLIGWVARNGRSIHVSPFERDSRVLGVYKEDQQLKSFIGIPVPVILKDGTSISGVVACDSKKAFAFSKLQGKLLEELGEEVGAIVSLHRKAQTSVGGTQTWEQFLKRGYELSETVGQNSIEVLRVRISNYQSLENVMGTGGAVQFVEQIFRLIGQSLPPHYPIYRGPLGEVLMIVDNMMANVYENKILAIASHTAIKGRKAEIEFRSRGFNGRVEKVFNLEKLVFETAFDAPEPAPTENPFLAKKIVSFR